MHNDGPVMMLAACHVMYIKAITPVSHTSPQGPLTNVAPDVMIAIQACHRAVCDIYAAHFTKGRFQQALLAAAKCDVESWDFRYNYWRGRPLINTRDPPAASLGVPASMTYDQNAFRCASINDILREPRPSEDRLKIEMATLHRTYQHRRGPCYQELHRFMFERCRAVEMFGAFPPPPQSQHGNDTHPGEDSRYSCRRDGQAALYLRSACADSIRSSICRQYMIAGQVIRDMFGEGGIDNYTSIVHTQHNAYVRTDHAVGLH
ncbi:hypothetical protein PENSPDRAFT_691412 [Peniophora sp. CONT]|nr:hypothetical protein PENSPDRAFT_691412 [Peniophora sp. CONT]